MKRILVWDLPVRLFHWILVGSFVSAFVIANVADDESPVFAIHMLMGGVAAFGVVLRVVWGFAGTRWARFSAFAASPRELFAYLRGTVRGGEKRYTGHNPGSGVAALVMFALILGLAATGVLMGGGGGAFEEVHEVLAWSMVAVVGAHLAGIAWYTFRHRENIARSMVDGRKAADPSGAIPTARPVVGLVFLLLTGLWAAGLVRGYDSASGRLTLPLTGQTLQVGEGAAHGEGSGGEEAGRKDHENREGHEDRESHEDREDHH